MSTTETSNDVKKAGGYLKEKFTIGISRVTGDEVSRAIMKTTSHLLKAPNEKHLNRLLAATHGTHSADAAKMHGNMCQYIVAELEKRSHTRNWIVVLKTMVTFHNLMIKGSDEVRKVMERNRNIFSMRNIKDVADSPDGAAQKVFIQQYIRYLEERNITQARIDVESCRIEDSDYLTMMKTMPDNILAAAMTQLLAQLECVANIEFREMSVDNFATLEAYNLLINDGKCLYVILSNRMVYMLEKFDEMDLTDKRQWLNIYRQYSEVVHKLSMLFNALISARRHFGTVVPRLKEFPPSLLGKLEEEIEYSSIPRGTVIDSSIPDPVPFTSVLAAAANDFNNAGCEGMVSSSVEGWNYVNNSGAENSLPKADPVIVPLTVETKNEDSIFDSMFTAPTQEEQRQTVKQPPSQTNTSAEPTVDINDLFSDASTHTKKAAQWTDTAPVKSSNNTVSDFFFDQNSNTQKVSWSSKEKVSSSSMQREFSGNFSDAGDHSSAFESLEDDSPLNLQGTSLQSQHVHSSSGTDLFPSSGFTDFQSRTQQPQTAPTQEFDPFNDEKRDLGEVTGVFGAKSHMESNSFNLFDNSDKSNEPREKSIGLDKFF